MPATVQKCEKINVTTTSNKHVENTENFQSVPVVTRDFRKANVDADTCHVIGIIAATQGKYIYEIIETAVRNTYPEFFKDEKKNK
jgi:hypothetical protein